MSSDNIWKPILATHFPSFFTTLPPSTAPFHRLFSIAHAAATRRHRKLTKPNLSLRDLIFAISISTRDHSRVVSTAKHCDTLSMEPPGVFRFGMGCCDGLVLDEVVKVTWNVALRGWRGIFTMMEREGKVGGGEGWFSQELPASGCCSNAVAASAVVADMKVEMCGGGKVRVRVGMLSVVDWRYVDVQDALRYLQHFLLT